MVAVAAIACLSFWLRDYLLLSTYRRRGQWLLLAGYAAVVLVMPLLVVRVLSHSMIAVVVCHAIASVVCAFLVLIRRPELVWVAALLPSPVVWMASMRAAPQGYLWLMALAWAASMTAATVRMRSRDLPGNAEFSAGIAGLSQVVAFGLLSVLLEV